MQSDAATIVVVEDVQHLAELLGFILEREGYRVFVVTSAAEALRHLQCASVDLVVTDYAMPDMDGADLLKAMRQNPDTVHIPTVLVSAYSEASVRPRCKGMSAFVQKPFKTSDLLQTVREVLGINASRH